MDKPQKGDRVRVTFEATYSHQVRVSDGAPPRRHIVKLDDGSEPHVPGDSIEVIRKALPPEPPVGSVVLCEGVAYQRKAKGWAGWAAPAGFAYSVWGWDRLHARGATVIYEAPPGWVAGVIE